jgi:hypothetical protein
MLCVGTPGGRAASAESTYASRTTWTTRPLLGNPVKVAAADDELKR